jgi:maltokinase
MAGVQPTSAAGGQEDSDGHDESDSHDGSADHDALNGSDGSGGQIEVDARQDVSEGLGGLVFAQRVHGDYHLGQVLRTTRGWMLLDFEGEPARSVAERRAVASPLKDIAGMLRSFDYAAQSVALDEKGDTDRALQWSEWNRAAFCRGYAAISGHDPWENAAALRAFEIEKAVYEVAYEAANRPSWLSIPLAACARLSAGRS